MVIMVKDLVSGCHTNQDGEIIFKQIAPLIFKGREVTLSFKGITSVSSSFINCAFIPLLDRVSFDQVKNYLSIIDSNRTINELIIRRFKQESDKTTV
jgi:hypothetical protein